MLSFRVRNNRIKAMALIIFFGLSILLLNNCEDEKAQARSYPQVRTNPVSGITSNGATFNAEIYSLGTEQIINHGFVWDENKYADLTDNKILLGPAGLSGVYSAEIVSSLAKDVEYTVKSFVQTAEHVVYGLPVTFKSLGSGAPVVSGFSPDSAAWLDTIRISGKNFSYEVSLNTVKLNQTPCNVVSATDTLLKVEVSTLVSDLKNLVSVDIEGNVSVFTKDTLKLIVPELTDFSPKKAFWGDTLKLKGKNFKSLNSQAANNIFLGTLKCERVGRSLTDTSISVIIPSELPNRFSDLSMKINGINLIAKQQFELLPPYFTFAPKSGTWGSTITLSGRFSNVAARNSIHFQGNQTSTIVLQQDILSTTLTTIKIRVPDILSTIKSVIIYEAAPFTVTSADTFRLAAPVITSFSPVMGSAGTPVTIKGKYFDITSTVVQFGNTLAYITNVNDSVIIADVPANLSGNVKISVSAKLQTTVSAGYFNVTNPKINGVSPLSGTFNDEITISGENFVSPSVTFEGIPATIKSSTLTTIVVLVPVEIDSIPRSLTVVSGINQLTSSEKFILSPPHISSATSSLVGPGGEVTITGTGFNPEPGRNIVLWDIYPLSVKSSTKTEITATWPQSVPRGNFGISVKTGGYSRTSSQKFTFNSQWLRIDAPNIPTTSPWAYYDGMSIYAKSLKNLGYLYSEVSKETYRFDPTTRAFTRLNITSPFDSYFQIKMGEVVCKDTFYLISGHMGNNYNMWAFDDIQNKWKLASGVPTNQAGVAFALNDKIYFGLDFYYPSLWFFECDPATNYSWNRLGDFPDALPFHFAAYFTLGNKGYVVFADNSVWQFDPDLVLWARKADFPGPARELAFSFIMNDKAYMGSGRSMNGITEYNDLWEYDPGTDVWVLKTYMPQNRHSAVAFSIGNKAYIGFGLHYGNYFQNDLYDFFEYDPNYPVK